ncbi:XTP/dITP diphosphatase [Desulfofundulus thermobenzoicus]|uniref:dITP/XTP pyrophosphatase n=1 Tax=Desulfofundulus thermobenzoicus TaxID=29376 RepID=A0A6N7IMI1_9FIRM|nr:XTP/dITP diphosphatase [Desulfofundulus thermobenzoicus]MQL51124.1 XTP/dITP diphosphatase [Desulfofundulus thermobenzoicus]
MELVLATRNPGKVRELSQMLAPLGYEVVSLDRYPGVPEIVEDGATFKDNAVKKAATVARHTGRLALADDSGLEVDYLGGAPGVYSARFAGEGHNDRANNEKLLNLLSGVPAEKRSARFRCVVAVATPDGRVFTAEGTCEGVITTEPRGEGGFGYDPLFLVPEYGKTFGELEPAVKNRISHRGRALALAREILAGLREGGSPD